MNPAYLHDMAATTPVPQLTTSAAEPQPPPAPIDVLGDMFTAVIAATNAPGRAYLADVVEYCHARRALGLDTRAMPVVFYTQTDAHLQAVTLPHMRCDSSLFSTSSLPSSRLSTRGLELQEQQHHTTASQPLGPPNKGIIAPSPEFGHPAFEEQTLTNRMDSESRIAYVRTRYHLDRSELSALGARYLDHLEDPAICPEPPRVSSHGDVWRNGRCPFSETHLNLQLGKHDYEEDFLMGDSGDGDSVYSHEDEDDEDEDDVNNVEDEETSGDDDSDDDEAESEYTEMSLVTRESSVEISNANQLWAHQPFQVSWAREQTSKANDGNVLPTDTYSAGFGSLLP
jgi:hypothetical protein